MITKEKLIKQWMENYPESSVGNCLKCIKYDYKKMQFRFFDEEEQREYGVDMKSLKAGLIKLSILILAGEYRNSMGQIPNIIAEGYEDDSQDHDALVQCAIFGEVRYG